MEDDEQDCTDSHESEPSTPRLNAAQAREVNAARHRAEAGLLEELNQFRSKLENGSEPMPSDLFPAFQRYAVTVFDAEGPKYIQSFADVSEYADFLRGHVISEIVDSILPRVSWGGVFESGLWEESLSKWKFSESLVWAVQGEHHRAELKWALETSLESRVLHCQAAWYDFGMLQPASTGVQSVPAADGTISADGDFVDGTENEPSKDIVKAERKALLQAYKNECWLRGEVMTDVKIAHEVSKRWHTRTEISRWLANDPRCTATLDAKIRRFLKDNRT